jgi:hypothetical protein
VKLTRSLPSGSQFLSYIDTIGKLDGTKCIIDWKTTTCRYPEQPQGLLALDPQLICYSWMAGISDVALIVFVRKNAPEIQYLKTSIDDQQRREFGQLVEATVKQIEAGQFLPHSGIRFPQNGCVSCAHLGICLGDQQLLDSKLIRRPGASDLDWIDQFEDSRAAADGTQAESTSGFVRAGEDRRDSALGTDDGAGHALCAAGSPPLRGAGGAILAGRQFEVL